MGWAKSVAFTTDGGYSFANQWTGWDDYDKLFGQMVRWAMRPVDEEGKFTVATDFKDGKVRVVVTALDKNDEFLNFLDMSATAVSPDLKPLDLRMEQTAPGRYVGEFPAADPGSYMVMLSPGPGKAPLRTGINVPFSDEFRGLATNETLLDRLAKLAPKGGAAGRLIDAPEEFLERDFDKLLAVNSFRHDLQRATSNQDAWYYAVLAACCLLFFDVFVRRVQVSVPWGKAWGFLLRRKPVEVAAPHHRTPAQPQGRGGLAVGPAPGHHAIRGSRRHAAGCHCWAVGCHCWLVQQCRRRPPWTIPPWHPRTGRAAVPGRKLHLAIAQS